MEVVQSRSLRGNVDRNDDTISPGTGGSSRSLRGNVDRNARKRLTKTEH